MILFLLSNILMLLMAFSFIWEGLAWKEVFGRRVSLDSLRLVTGILDKMTLIQIFGSPDNRLVFFVSYWQILKVRPFVRWIFGNKLIEFFLFIVLWQMTWNGAEYGWPGFGLVIGYYLVGYLIYASKAKKVHYQFVHEKLKRYGPKSETGFSFDHLGSGTENTSDKKGEGGDN